MRMTTMSACLLLALLLSQASAAPLLRQANRFQAPTTMPLDRLMLERDAKLARPLPQAYLQNLNLPSRVDYSGDLNFIRNQNNGGGCMTYAVTYMQDIINKWLAPYTPDVSFRYAENNFDLGVMELIKTQLIFAVPDMLNWTFNHDGRGLASEGLCPSNYDALTNVTATTPDTIHKVGDHLQWNPQPSAEANEEARLYRVAVSEPITPSLLTLKLLMRDYGPVWSAGPWWWNGAHAMALVGYDDQTKQITYVDSSGDWAHSGGFGTIPYDKLTTYVNQLRVVENLMGDRTTGRWAYSSRIRIHGVWRGTWTVSIGVEGRPLLNVWKTHGRMADRRYEYGDKLDFDVPLPSYAPECWPPSAKNRWVLKVEDNDRDGLQGQVVEWTLARRYADPLCQSVDHYKTETFGGATSVTVPDATGQPLLTTAPGPGVAAPPTPNSTPGVATLQLPKYTPLGPVLQPWLRQSYRISLLENECGTAVSGQLSLDGNLLTRLTANQGWLGAVGKQVVIYRLDMNGCLNKPASWMKVATMVTGPQGKFAGHIEQPLDEPHRVYAVAFLGSDGRALASTPCYEVEGALHLISAQGRALAKPFPDLVPPNQRTLDPVLFTRKPVRGLIR